MITKRELGDLRALVELAIWFPLGQGCTQLYAPGTPVPQLDAEYLVPSEHEAGAVPSVLSHCCPRLEEAYGTFSCPPPHPAQKQATCPPKGLDPKKEWFASVCPEAAYLP